MKAQITADPKLLSLLGRKLYTKSPIVIAVRELLQNSEDACLRAGVEPQITILVEHTSGGRKTLITCTDNGCGMDEEEIVTKFLCLGGSSKAGTNSTGRFGVAKAVLMIGTYWSVWTHDNQLDSETVFSGGDIGKSKDAINGTEITCEYTGDYSWDFENEALMMVLFSSVDVHYTYEKDGKIVWDIPHCGFRGDLVELARGDTWIGYGTPTVKVDELNFCGFSFIRLNGLVQFKQWTSGNTMDGNILVDLQNHFEIDHKDFPLVMSREKLSGPTNDEVSKFLAQRAENSKSTDVAIQRSLETPDIKFVHGRVLTGTRDPHGSIEQQRLEVLDSDNSNTSIIADFIRNAQYSKLGGDSDLIQYIDPRAHFPIMRLHDYEPAEDDIERDGKFINCWARVLELTLLAGTQFGVGLIGNSNIISEIEPIENVYFFSLNPRLFMDQPTNEALVLQLWVRACHEMAHIAVRAHNEVFSATWDYIMEASVGIIWANMKRLAKLLE